MDRKEESGTRYTEEAAAVLYVSIRHTHIGVNVDGRERVLHVDSLVHEADRVPALLARCAELERALRDAVKGMESGISGWPSGRGAIGFGRLAEAYKAARAALAGGGKEGE